MFDLLIVIILSRNIKFHITEWFITYLESETENFEDNQKNNYQNILNDMKNYGNIFYKSLNENPYNLFTINNYISNSDIRNCLDKYYREVYLQL